MNELPKVTVGDAMNCQKHLWAAGFSASIVAAANDATSAGAVSEMVQQKLQ